MRFLITSERAQREERVLSYLRGKSEYSRPDPTRPDLHVYLSKFKVTRDRARDKTLKSVMGPGRVGSGRAANTQISPLNTKELAPLAALARS